MKLKLASPEQVAMVYERDLKPSFPPSELKPLANIQAMCREEGLYGYNVNASGRRCASTVFIMIVSGIILYLVYGVGSRDLGERLEIKDRRRKRRERLMAKLHRAPKTSV